MNSNNSVVEREQRNMTNAQRAKLVNLIIKNVNNSEDRNQSFCYLEGLSFTDAEEYLQSFEE